VGEIVIDTVVNENDVVNEYVIEDVVVVEMDCVVEDEGGEMENDTVFDV
jgi:hypothetical protein